MKTFNLFLISVFAKFRKEESGENTDKIKVSKYGQTFAYIWLINNTSFNDL